MAITDPDPATSRPEVARPRRRPRSRSGSLLVVAFAVLLTVPWLLGGRTGATTENRASQPLPGIGPSNLLHARTYRQVDGALRDRLTLRADLIRAVGASGYDTAGLSLNGQVHAGTDGELFLTADFTNPCTDKLDIDRLAQRLRALSALTGNRPGAVTLVVAPDKSAVLPDRLGSLRGALLPCADLQRDRIERLAEADPDRVIDLIPRARAIRAAEPGTELYTKVDTHWTPRLATIYGSTLVPRLARQTGAGGVRWSDPVVKGTVQYGDLLGLLGLGVRSETRDALVSRRPGAVTTSTTIAAPEGRPIWVTRTTGAPVIGGRTLFLYDSFTATRGFGNDVAAPQLIPYFSDVTWVHWSDLKAFIAAGRLPKVDRIVMESVQRMAGRNLNDILDPAVEAALGEALEP